MLPRWIIAVAALPYGDIIASGSWDGQIRIWALDDELRSFEFKASIPAAGFINSICTFSIPSSHQISIQDWKTRAEQSRQAKADRMDVELTSVPKPKASASTKSLSDVMLVAAVGREMKLGRWRKPNQEQNHGDRTVVAQLIKGVWA